MKNKIIKENKKKRIITKKTKHSTPSKKIIKSIKQKFYQKPRMYEYSVFTDGSVINNGKPTARGGVGIFFKDRDMRNCSEPFFLKPITNNRAELYAAIRAIQNFAQNSYWNPATQGFSKTRKYYNLQTKELIKPKTKTILRIYTDSEMVVNIIQKWITIWKKSGWKTTDGKPVKNLDLIIQLYELIEYYYDHFLVMLTHTKAHRKEPNKSAPDYSEWYGNMMADQLSKMTYARQFKVPTSTFYLK
jgi:ribonuclease HI